MKLSIIIPVWNNWNFTKACLKDLSKLPNDHEVIIIDNGSDDKTKLVTTTLGMIEDHIGVNIELYTSSKFSSMRNEENTGFAHACNQGYASAKGEYVLFLNNDVRVRRDFDSWTSKLIDAAEEDCLVGPTGGILDSELNFITETNKLHDGNFYMSGWCLLASKKTFDKLVLPEYDGPFTEEFTTYFEDTDLSFRAKELGIQFKIVDVPVKHFGKMTSKKLNTLSLYLPAKKKFINKWKTRI